MEGADKDLNLETVSCYGTLKTSVTFLGYLHSTKGLFTVQLKVVKFVINLQKNKNLKIINLPLS